MKNTFARTAIVDHEAGDVIIDGVRLPYWIEQDPEVANLDGVINVVRIGILIDGPVTLRAKDGHVDTYDTHLGKVRDWVKALFARVDIPEETP